MEISHAYDDIIDLPHHVSAERPQMALIDRAAQFAPFAALTGYDAAIQETARLTEKKQVLSEDQQMEMDQTLMFLMGRIREKPIVTVSFFVPDERKEGGHTETIKGSVKKMDPVGGCLTMSDGRVIPFENLYAIRLEAGTPDGKAD